MEQKDIQFNKGIHRAPSIEAEDGELSECVNLIPKNGELVNVKVPVMIGVSTSTKNELLMAIHEVENETHYITKQGKALGWTVVTEERTSWTSIGDIAENLKQVVVIGNALVLIYEQSARQPMKYALWNRTQRKYLLLDEKPEVEMNFSLEGSLVTETYSHSFSMSDEDSDPESGSWTKNITAVQATTTASIGTLMITGDTETYQTLWNNALSFEGRTYRRVRIKNNNSYHVKVRTTTDKTTIPAYSTDIEAYSSALIDIYQPTDEDKIAAIHITFTGDQTEYSFVFYGYDSESSSTCKKTLTNTEDDWNAFNGNLKNYLHNLANNQNKYVYPFFLRYGLKMFDGSICNLSEPILLMPNSGAVPVTVFVGTADGESKGTAIVSALLAKLKMQVVKCSGYDDWKDLYTGVAIGITSPVYSYNQGLEYNEYKKQVTTYEFSDYVESNQGYGVMNESLVYLANELSARFGSEAKYVIEPPSYSADRIKTNYLSSSIFYKIKEYTWDEFISLGTELTDIDLASYDEDLDVLQTLPTIADEKNTSDRIYPANGFVYNSRLNIFNIKEALATPQLAVSPIITTTSATQFRTIIYVREQGGEYVAKSAWSNQEPVYKFVYYGNSNAYKCIFIKKTNGTYSKAEVNLSPHPWLIGSYALINDTVTFVTTTDKSDYDPDVDFDINLFYYPNAIYASNTNNPFYFPISGQNIIGTGTIKTVSTAAKALSEGQFGQFPLYAFATDGIWALSVSEEGTYTTSNPVNRDVIYDNADVCQIDDSVVYACSQGLKRLSGSESQVLSTAMEGNNVDESEFLGYTDEEGVYQGTMDEQHQELAEPDTNTMVNMLQNCRILYDSSEGRRLHIYPTSVGSTKATGKKHYIYDIDSGEWATAVNIESQIDTIVPKYPYSVIQTTTVTEYGQENQLMSFTNAEDNSTIRYGVLLTRAMEFGNPFVMKMLCDLKMIYTKRSTDSKCKIAVFVSNDRVNWKQLTSLRKHSYKWYRFRIQTAMTDLDALTAVSCLIDTRRDNKLR